MRMMVCIDDTGGMLFNHRRVSRDKNVYERMLEISNGYKLYITAFSASLFDGKNKVETDDFTKCNPYDYCFAEDISLRPYEKNIDELILFKWNRAYPSDFKLDIDMSNWKLITVNEFIGSSHEKITEEHYVKMEGTK